MLTRQVLCQLSYSGNGTTLRRWSSGAAVLAPGTFRAQTTRVQLPDGALSERDRAILDLERAWWLVYRSKELAIRSELELSPSRYYQRLHDLIDRPAALEYDPLVVRRARRARAARRRARVEGKTVLSPPAHRPRT